MPEPVLDLSGLSVLTSTVNALVAAEKKLVSGTIEHVAYETKHIMRYEAPVRSGGLRDSVSYNMTRAASSAVIGARAPHSSIVEGGTSMRKNRNGASRGRMPPNPFVERTSIQVTRLIDAAVDAVWETIHP
ncbi:MAG: hypothetical protein LBJ43_00545 [Propionibacteriaceae bacterium]|jgi:hypothetical protein|nr:hypothetical protein [Propionibacteriaceae bacterium]